MSRTTRRPAHRRTRNARERLFDRQPCAVPVDPWATFDDPALSTASRRAAAIWLGLSDPEPSDTTLLAAACPHWDATGDRISCTEAEEPPTCLHGVTSPCGICGPFTSPWPHTGADSVQVRTELTQFANGF
jgi:hypothetical protein